MITLQMSPNIPGYIKVRRELFMDCEIGLEVFEYISSPAKLKIDNEM